MEEIYWDAIAITAPKYDHCTEFIKELQTKQNQGLINKKTNLLPIPDPIIDKTGNTKIGSGSSVINSLYVITEKLSALDGKNYLDVDIFKEKRILLLLIGGLHQHTPLVNICTKSFSILPIDNLELCDSNGNVKKPIEHKEYVGDVKPIYTIDILLSNLNRLVNHLPQGLVVSSTEYIMFLDLEKPFHFPTDLHHIKEGVTIFTVQVDKPIITNHGICRIDPESKEILEIAYKEPYEDLKERGFINEDGTALVYSSLMFFSELVTEKILYLYNTPPIDSCTYLGLDNGNQVLKFGIFPDILCTMTKNETYQSYMDKPIFHDCNQSLLERGRRVLWKIFRDTPIHSVQLNGKYYYLKNTRDFFDFILSNEHISPRKMVHSFIEPAIKISQFSIITNSILTGQGEVGDKSIVTCTALSGKWSIGNGCVVIGVESYAHGLTVRDNMVCHEIRLKSKSFKFNTNKQENTINNGTPVGNSMILSNFTPKALIMLGVDDNPNLLFTDPKATIANRPWSEFFAFSGVLPEELWPPNLSKTLKTARLFPVLNGDDKIMDASLWIQEWVSPPLSIIGRWRSSMRVSIADILGESNYLDYLQLGQRTRSLKQHSKQIIEGDIAAEFEWKRNLDYIIDASEVENIILSGQNKPIIQYFKKWFDSGVSIGRALATLDRIALSSPVHFTGRILSCISDLLATFVNNKGGLRSGPARNIDWLNAFSCFSSGNERRGFLQLAKERDKWLNCPENMIRAARHYEGAGQLVVKSVVDLCESQLVPLDPTVDSMFAKFGEWAQADVPARIDLAGGWTDTPPICYEHGGYVINAAIKIEGRCPIQVKAKRIPELKLIFYYDLEMKGEPFICLTNKDLSDYSQPSAACALLKACFLQLGLVKLESDLAPQLEKLGGGMIVCTQSSLPTGSGLGTSSILASAIVHIMAHIYGYKYSPEHLIHATLKVEQMLTTSGGYQDQVGGIIGGIKESYCSKFLDQQQKKTGKIQVTFNQLDISPDILKKINSHLLLVYTGRTRLARDLLQDVVRRWYAKTTEILQVTDALISTAKKMKEALINGDIEQIGLLLTEYWGQKKYMASGAEPTRVSNLIKILSPYSYGSSLMGAGGGGFGVLICKQPATEIYSHLNQVLDKSAEFKNVIFYLTEIDTTGLKFEIINENSDKTEVLNPVR